VTTSAVELALTTVTLTRLSPPLDEPQDVFVIKEKWGKNDTVPDTQIFKLDHTKSARYHKRKIKLTPREDSRTAWQVGAPANAEGPTPPKQSPIVPDSQIFKLDSTKSAKHKRKMKLVPRSSGTTGRDDASTNAESSAPLRSSTIPSLNVGLVRASTAIMSPGTATMSTEPNSVRLSTSVLNLSLVRARTATMPTGSKSLRDREFARSATKGRELLGTVHLDGTVKTKRRWFCCGKRALNATEQRAIAAAMPQQKEKIGNALDTAITETIQDRVRRSHRNVRQTYNLEITFCCGTSFAFLIPSVKLTLLLS
jgi:hypothetical protein